MSITSDDQSEMKIYYILNQIVSALHYFQQTEWETPDKTRRAFKKKIVEMLDEIVIEKEASDDDNVR